MYIYTCRPMYDKSESGVALSAGFGPVLGFCHSTDFQGNVLGSISAAGKAVTFSSLINTSSRLSSSFREIRIETPQQTFSSREFNCWNSFTNCWQELSEYPAFPSSTTFNFPKMAMNARSATKTIRALKVSKKAAIIMLVYSRS